MLTLGAHFLAILMWLLVGHGLFGAEILSCVLAWLVALFLTLPAYALKWLGAGDVKMFAAIGLLTGLQFTLITFVVAALLAGFLSISWLFLLRAFPYLNLHLKPYGRQLPLIALPSGKILPFGAFLALGVVVTMLLTAR